MTRLGGSVRSTTYVDPVISFEFGERLYNLTEQGATQLAEHLRNYAKGKFTSEVRRASELSGNPNWTDGALAASDVIEDALVGSFNEVIPLEGKAAEATCWALRLLPDLGASREPTDMAALRDALAEAFPAVDRREAA